MKNNANKFMRILGFVSLVVIGASTPILAATDSSNMQMHDMSEMNMHEGADKSHDMKQTMQSGMNDMQSMESTGNVDKDFAMMMKIHHQQALEMAKMELAHGKSSSMKAMARKIITAQKKEIAQFDSWLAKQK